MKGHLLAPSLSLLPVYRLLWHKASEANRIARAVLTSVIAIAVWWCFRRYQKSSPRQCSNTDEGLSTETCREVSHGMSRE
jgi:hypothetical protein